MKRFGFGQNWLNYARTIDARNILEAENSLQAMINAESLKGKSFLDAGSGSGLFSLAAHNLGATPVVSFDYDPESVVCTEAIRHKYGKRCSDWTIQQGDILNGEWLSSLGEFDIVYSWGVLHHTGDMWLALNNICACVKLGGLLFISIYNDQGWKSRAWKSIKYSFTHSGPMKKFFLISLYMTYFLSMRTLRGVARFENPLNWYRSSGRGMTIWFDAIDWIGGYPYESAKPAEIEQFLLGKGFVLSRSNIKNGSGCNEFVLKRLYNSEDKSRIVDQ